MLTSVLDHIKANILSLNPNTFQNGYAGARQLQDGKPTVYDNSEGQYVGLTDNKGNYFYIRYLGNIEIDIAPDDSRSTSCEELQGNAPVRLVAWVNKGDLGKLIEVLLNDISSTDFNTMTQAARERFSDIKFTFSAIQPDPEQIYKDETLETENDNVQTAKGVTLVAIDFGIVFNYKMKNNDCIDRDICTDCAA